MKNFNHLGIIIGGTIFCACAFVATALANPAMLPDHPGHPMKPLKSPVTGQSLANDPGRAQAFGQEALNKSTQEAHEDLNILSDSALEEKHKKEAMESLSGSQNRRGNQ